MIKSSKPVMFNFSANHRLRGVAISSFIAPSCTTLPFAIYRRNFTAAAHDGKKNEQEGKSSSSTSEDDEKSRSDEQYEKTGSYDTQDDNKRVGNPIQWANPTGGPTMDDHSSEKWSKV